VSRFTTLAIVVALFAASAALSLIVPSIVSFGLLALFGLLTARGIWELVQTRHSLARNYPLIWFMRYLFETIRPQIRQYLIESDTDGAPFDREQRSLAYQRAKSSNDLMPFGTERNVAAVGFEWINPSIQPARVVTEDLRVAIGGSQCARPYSASIFNISAMSFGSLGRHAIEALNLGARTGGFAHDTGEGGLSPHHLRHGGDVIWEIGSGYFGCRTLDGQFDGQRFRDNAAHEQVRMIELKLSQGAKAGHGGILPARKVTAEIAAIRGVPAGVDCISPARHSAFDTPATMLEFLASLRELAGGKPVGFKLCVGHRWEFLGICKAMISTGIVPDFIVVDGKEGGTGAAPVEFSDHVGTPAREGLITVVNALTGCGLRDRIRIGVAGKIISGFDIALALALGADWCNSARGFMFALGCLQSQKCHLNKCPVGVATQDESRQRGLDVRDKATRVANFHRHTVAAFAEILAASGVPRPDQLTPATIYRRVDSRRTETLEQAYDWMAPGQLVDGGAQGSWLADWDRASPDRFAADLRRPLSTS